MRIRKRWLLQSSTSPMPSNPQLPVQQRQIGGTVGQQQNTVEARSARLHPNHEFMSAIAWPKLTKNQPQSHPRSEDDEEEPPVPPHAAPVPSTGSTKTSRRSWMIHPEHGGTPKEINRTRPPNQSEGMKAAIHQHDKGTSPPAGSSESTSSDHGGSPFLSSHPVGRWSAGEKAFPFKKRRPGGYDWGEIAGGETVEEKKKNMRSKVKRNTPSNEEKQEEEEEEEQEDEDGDDDDDDYDDEEERAVTVEKNLVMRRKGRKAGGGLLRRGSRCSRVNGRGWQCSRLTLVGYSLCEHHLGKGRSKSMGGSMVGMRRRSARRPSRNRDNNDCDLSSRALSAEEAMVEEDNQKREVAIATAWPLSPIMVVKKKRGRRLGWKRLDNSLLGQAHKHPKM